MSEASSRIEPRTVVWYCRVGWVDRHVHYLADAFDDAGIDLPVEGLRGAIGIGVGVDDGDAGLCAGNALGDDRLHGGRNAGLKIAAPCPFNATSIQTLRAISLTSSV